VGNQQLSIHIKTLLDDFKSSKKYCPRKLFSGSNSSPKNLSRKIARFLVSKISPATGVTPSRFLVISISSDVIIVPSVMMRNCDNFESVPVFISQLD